MLSLYTMTCCYSPSIVQRSLSDEEYELQFIFSQNNMRYITFCTIEILSLMNNL